MHASMHQMWQHILTHIFGVLCDGLLDMQLEVLLVAERLVPQKPDSTGQCTHVKAQHSTTQHCTAQLRNIQHGKYDTETNTVNHK
jgi:hypothetical protein